MAPSLERGLDELPQKQPQQTTFIEPEPRIKRERYKTLFLFIYRSLFLILGRIVLPGYSEEEKKDFGFKSLAAFQTLTSNLPIFV